MQYDEFYNFVLKVHAISKIGLVYSKDPYALENYQELNDLSKSMIENFMNIKFDKPSMFSKDIYPTPSVSVRTFIRNDKNEVLLVKEANSNLWSLPGGWCDYFESPSFAAKKEVSQEAGVECDIIRLVGVLDRTPHKLVQTVSEYVLLFEGTILNHKFHDHSHETNEVKFFPINKLPDMSKKLSMEEIEMFIDAIKNNKTIYD